MTFELWTERGQWQYRLLFVDVFGF